MLSKMDVGDVSSVLYSMLKYLLLETINFILGEPNCWLLARGMDMKYCEEFVVSAFVRGKNQYFNKRSKYTEWVLLNVWSQNATT